MNSLRDKLLKAGLVTEEAVKRVESEKKTGKRSGKQSRGGQKGTKKGSGSAANTGKEGAESFVEGARAGPCLKTSESPSTPLPKEERLSPEEIAASEARRLEMERKREIEEQREANRRLAAIQKEKAEEVRLVAEHLGLDMGGEKVFHFLTRKKKLRRMLLSEDAVSSLEKGDLAIIEHPLPHAIEHALVPREGAEAVLKIEARSVRFYNRSPDERYGIRE